MSESYDDSGFTAPQYGMPRDFDRIVANSGHEGSFLNVLFKLRRNPLALPGLVITIVGGVLVVY